MHNLEELPVMELLLKQKIVITRIALLIANGLHMENGVNAQKNVAEESKYRKELSKLMKPMVENHVLEIQPDPAHATKYPVHETVFGKNLDIGLAVVNPVEEVNKQGPEESSKDQLTVVRNARENQAKLGHAIWQNA